MALRDPTESLDYNLGITFAPASRSLLSMQACASSAWNLVGGLCRLQCCIKLPAPQLHLPLAPYKRRTDALTSITITAGTARDFARRTLREETTIIQRRDFPSSSSLLPPFYSLT
jgi:hypothetical protein